MSTSMKNLDFNKMIKLLKKNLTEKCEDNNNGSGYKENNKSKLSKISQKPVDVGLEWA